MKSHNIYGKVVNKAKLSVLLRLYIPSRTITTIGLKTMKILCLCSQNVKNRNILEDILTQNGGREENSPNNIIYIT